MRIMPKINALVVLSHEANATMWRVKNVSQKLHVGVIDATIEDKHPNQAVHWVDLSVLLNPTIAQLDRFTSR